VFERKYILKYVFVHKVCCGFFFLKNPNPVINLPQSIQNVPYSLISSAVLLSAPQIYSLRSFRSNCIQLHKGVERPHNVIVGTAVSKLT